VEPAVGGPLSWTALDQHRWEAHCGDSLIGTVEYVSHYGGEYAVVPVEAGVIGHHSSLENAKAQLEAWARWRRTSRSAP
jgi:hypothetical protein